MTPCEHCRAGLDVASMECSSCDARQATGCPHGCETRASCTACAREDGRREGVLAAVQSVEKMPGFTQGWTAIVVNENGAWIDRATVLRRLRALLEGK